MAKLAKPRAGDQVLVRGRPITFSYWPTYRTSRRYGLHSHVYATNPWALIHVSVRRFCPAVSRDEALASVEQAEFFYRSAIGAREWAAKPLPLYYSFLNLAKAYALTLAIRSTFDQARHGLAEKLSPGGKDIAGAFLEAHPSPSGGVANIFDDFRVALGAPRLLKKSNYQLVHLLPQVVPGHRLWCDASGSDERFFAVESAPFLHVKATKHMWSALRFFHDDLKRVGKSHKDFLKETRLGSVCKEVEGIEILDRELIQFEQSTPITYSSRPADKIVDVVGRIRPLVWSTVTTNRPFRRYYLYASPISEHGSLLPQAASIYAIAFYLGSITRYRPQQFVRILTGEYGEFIQEFLSSQPSQFVYLMASDFGKRDVAKAPLA